MSHQNRIDLIRPDAPHLAQCGPYAVGVQTHTLDMSPDADLAPRRLTVEIWYPAAKDAVPGTRYSTILRDGITPVSFGGSACRDATPAQGISAPLVVLSHGYPGNRYLMSHLAESLAAKGYVVATPDHLGSTYDDQQEFGLTLLHRPLDQRGVIDAVAGMGCALGALADADQTAIIGYSMGGYGALVLGGAGLSQTALKHERALTDATLDRHLAGSTANRALHDPRIKAIVPIGPWGNAAGMWDSDGLAGLKVPMLLIAGTDDEVSGYAAMQRIFTQTRNVDRHMLSFTHAGHNAAAPVPAPIESWAKSDSLGWAPFAHYADPVWDTCRMNNITQHFVAAFLGLHLKGDSAMGASLTDPDWPGFADQSARGLTLEHLSAEG